MKKTRKPELLAPAGNIDKMKTAFAYGADAVYAGIPDFSLRVRINDFTLDTLREAVEYAHARKKKVYVTINIFAHNEHIKKLPKYLKELKKIQPDALIVSDPGVIAVIQKHWPEAEIHLSTQANCTNGASAMFWHKAGATRVILGREVAYEDILEMKKAAPKLELETFIHGAMCMAYSGRCFLSKYLKDRSGNLGDCVQPCRWPYSAKATRGKEYESIMISPDGHEAEFELVEEEHGSYILNSNDMCLMNRVPELVVSGLESLKIEGRAKSNYYLAMVVGAYRKAIDIATNQKIDSKTVKKEIAKLNKELETKLVHRGYTEGFMFGAGQQAQNLVNTHNVCEWEFCGQVVDMGAWEHGSTGVRPQSQATTLIKVHNAIRVGDKIEIVTPEYDIIKMKVARLFDAETGEAVASAHGGQGKMVLMNVKSRVPEYSVIRRLNK